ncbi:jasmonate-induced oxygenase 4-like [Nicotiana sylvestris]|uniref:Leucoanthocyanidin dioxygenase-like n=2 Tax=Nicotiana TaxID=4085 RepID=A0A1S4BI45_TOBAC|nr:PREDICTED: leucoanthocyanidin dioxygenase-like [Nicotiana sylvestris]XP_016488517.1 PREDICTED: leucoanthocyanidin dioxygenase-like [Nicotiana tabacum]
MSCLQSWPEPIVRVQALSESGIQEIPHRFIKRPADRPCFIETTHVKQPYNNIPLIDLENLKSTKESVRSETMKLISQACRDWGFFQVVNHGVSHDLMAKTRGVWREFFHLPLEEKQKFANSPTTYEGYGSRLGVEKGGKLDWSDYFFLHFLPEPLRDEKKWPNLPITCRKIVAEYGQEGVKLCERILKILSLNLGLNEDYLHHKFGGDSERGACLRVNFYPKCPQPDLTLGLSSHSDPGGMTLLLPDIEVAGLQVRRGNNWLTVKPVPNAFIVNIGDQIQVLSNGTYKSVEHRVIVNSAKERVSLAFFYNPGGDKLIKPADELVTEDRPALYFPTTFNKYRALIRTKGPCGKSQIESLKSLDN